MSTEYLARVFQQRSQSRIVRFYEQVGAKATLDNLVPEHWKRFRTERTGDGRDGLRLIIYAAGDEDGDGRDAEV